MNEASLRFALLGHPVGHSISPAIHARAYAVLGLPHRYELVDAPDEAAVRQVFARLRSGEFAGLNVTVPWKRIALELADRADPRAREVGAANVLVRHTDGTLEAHNTDVLALAEELVRHAPRARTVLVIGNGGAALAAAVAAKSLGNVELWVTARAFDPGKPPDAWSHAAEFRAIGARILPWVSDAAPDSLGAWQEQACKSHVLLQATSAGMHGADTGEALAVLVPWQRLAPGTFAYDVVYNPPITPFLRSAARASLPHAGGLEMLVGQAAHAFELWLGRPAPRAEMREAAEAALARKVRE